MQQLHEGPAPENVKLAIETGSLEMTAVEQGILAEDMTPGEVGKFCELHEEVYA